MRRAAEQLQYQPNGIARDLRMRRTHTIAVFLHNLSGPFYSELISGVESVAETLALTAIVTRASVTKQQGSHRLLREGRVDGAIVLDPHIESEELCRYASENLPVVVLDRALGGVLQSDYITAVAADHLDGGYRAGQHLLAQGFRRMAFIAGPIDSEHSRLRQIGFFRALDEAGIDTVKVPVVHGDFTESGGYRAMDSLLDTGIPWDGIFAANDEMAIGALQCLTDHGRHVPEDVGLMGFDDIRLARYLHPSLTTVRQPMYELGVAAMRQLEKALAGQTRIPPITLPTTLIIRESTQRGTQQGGSIHATI
ncbi:LacI-family regulatory protein [Sulfobacillus acidophilus TPY]|nr:LacI-family regulatory protein [Sulfobacillus acidophilus TPY]